MFSYSLFPLVSCAWQEPQSLEAVRDLFSKLLDHFSHKFFVSKSQFFNSISQAGSFWSVTSKISWTEPKVWAEEDWYVRGLLLASVVFLMVSTILQVLNGLNFWVSDGLPVGSKCLWESIVEQCGGRISNQSNIQVIISGADSLPEVRRSPHM